MGKRGAIGNTQPIHSPKPPSAPGREGRCRALCARVASFWGGWEEPLALFCGWGNKGEAPGGASFLLQGLDSAGGYFAVAFRNVNGFVGVPIWAASPENGLPSTMSTDPWVRDIFLVSAFSEKSISARGIQKR